MKFMIYILLPVALLFFGCSNDESKSQDLGNDVEKVDSNVHSGTVIETMDGGSYSYIHVDENDNRYWIAVTHMDIEEGETIYFSQFMEMKDFKSETLDKTFDSILFVSDASKTPITTKMPSGHTGRGYIDKNNVEVGKVSGGMTIAEIYKDKDDLHRKQVKVRGKVVKVNNNIMDRNWIHIQDGTADGENFDLLLTTKQSANVGEVIIAEGEIVLDRDFGAGYAYPVLMENAKISQ